MDESSRALLRKAITLLADNYNITEDSFFLVITKDGKNPELHDCDQTIVGELNIRSLVAFIVAAINQLCASVDMHPHIFISRYITSAFLNQDRLKFFDSLGEPFFEDLDDEEDFSDDEWEGIAEEEEDEVIYVPNLDWEDIKN